MNESYLGNYSTDDIFRITNIDMSVNRSILWIAWNAIEWYDMFTLSRIWHNQLLLYYHGHRGIGFGDTVNLQRISNASLVGGIYKIRVYGGKFSFYHDACLLALDVNIVGNAFAVGDYLDIQYNLSQATELNLPMYIQSNEMKLNYSMQIK